MGLHPVSTMSWVKGPLGPGLESPSPKRESEVRRAKGPQGRWQGLRKDPAERHEESCQQERTHGPPKTEVSLEKQEEERDGGAGEWAKRGKTRLVSDAEAGKGAS